MKKTMQNQTFLYQKFDTLSEMDVLNKNIPLNISKNLNEKFQIREYQKEAFSRFLYYLNDYKNKMVPIHLLYNMATGSGKTFVMAGIILALYDKGYRNFLFFVNSSNIIEKTKDNFLNNNSLKYLFNDKINFDGKQVHIKEVSNFSNTNNDNTTGKKSPGGINIKFTTIQGLHTDLNTIKENGLSYVDFEDKKIVILSDEAHHINALTKVGKLKVEQQKEKTSWENTVMKILNSNSGNLLLEFTATIDLVNENIVQKYLTKIIYKYDLKEFRLDGYSKEVDILKADMIQDDRILQALILSQYRLKVAEKNKIFCKPVILFKAQKKIAESEQNLENFKKLIKNLKINRLENIKNSANTGIIKNAFKFFEENKISLQDLVGELKDDFHENNCISANDSSDLVSIKLNTLENKNNNIRAIFAVAKLNEGWDVLNLFDIVRLYGDDGITSNRSNVIDRKTGKVKSGPQTVAEAQLIGRGARYFPFSCEKALGEDKYKRKFDDKNDELKVLETFYYHTFFDSLYITEIKQALRNTGMLDEIERKNLDLKFKDSFKSSNFYQNGVIFTNTRIIKNNSNNNSLKKLGIKCENFDYNIFTGKSDDIKVFENKKSNLILERSYKTYILKDIDEKTTKKAIAKNDFFKFNNLKLYFPNLKSINEFIKSCNYLGNIKINISSSHGIVYNLSVDDKLKSILSLLQYLQGEIKDKKIEFEGSKEFKSKAISKYDFEKSIKIDLGVDGFGINKDWFVFEEVNGSSEEINFIELFEKKVVELSKRFEDIYLIRNERTIAIYSFDDGDRFEPDFLLFMKDKANKIPITYQIFIEPKGNHLLEVDKWKEDFLNQIEKKAEIIEINLGNYYLFGLPFYNKNNESEFEKAFDKEIKKLK